MDSLSQQLRVLVIDDDEIMREVLSALLSAEGDTVTAFETGEDALQALRAGAISDVILSDVQLPGLSGAPLAVQLRAAAPGTFLLGMSGSQPGPDVQNAFDGFLLKPFTMEDFAATLSAAKQHASSPSLAAAPIGPPDTGLVLDESTFARLAQGLQPAPLAELYDLTLQDAAMRVTRMGDALLSGDFVTYRSEAHALKGGCSMVGAVELAGLAKRAEFSAGSSGDTPRPKEFSAAAERLRRILAARFRHQS